MPRLVLYLFLALATIGATGSAAVAATAPECTMVVMSDMSDMTDMTGDHEHRDCCTPECALASPGAAIPFQDIGISLLAPVSVTAWADRQTELMSIAPEALDPPPRTHLT